MKITARYVGEEPKSQVTGIYNQVMEKELPEAGVSCVIVPRKQMDEEVISASTVRQCIRKGDMEALRRLVPDCTWKFFQSKEAIPVIQKIRKAENVVHY